MSKSHPKIALPIIVLLVLGRADVAGLAQQEETTRVDKYASLDALKLSEREGIDYKINVLDRKSWATVVSPHGGYIEQGTSELAAAIAGGQYNLYDFQSVQKDRGRDLHVTATHFVDPVLENLLERSLVCITVHGRRGDDQVAWVGGLNESLKSLIAEQLQKRNISVNTSPSRLAGVSPKNMVNKAKEKGVQLELPWALAMNQAERDNIAAAVRAAFSLYPKRDR